MSPSFRKNIMFSSIRIHVLATVALGCAVAFLTAGSLAAQVEIRETSSYRLIWNDAGSGADADVAFYRPVAASGWYIVGDYAQGSYSQPTGSSYVIRATSGHETSLKAPVDYDLVWNDAGSGADLDGSVWKPRAPAGYVCLGFVANGSHAKPQIADYRCLREDLATRGDLGPEIWADRGSGADHDVSIWAINDHQGGPTGTFAASGGYSAPGGVFYTLEGLLARQAAGRPAKPVETADDKLNLLVAHAPRVWLALGEEFLPSSVEWAFPYLTRFLDSDGRYWVRTKEKLDSPSDDSLEVFKGNLESAPVYAFWVAKGEHVDLVYYFYYPYNRGKRILRTIWGNHVGDWEHITVRLAWSFDGGSWSLEPHQVYIAAHNFGGAYPWNEVQKVGSHPIVYSARGSHGSWKDPGNHVYKDLGWLGDLVDETGEGVAWDTWRQVEAFDFTEKRGLGSSRWPRWMSPDFSNPGTGDPSDPASGPIYRWGNTKEGCGAEVISGECRLNDGPTGPISKSVWDPNNFE